MPNGRRAHNADFRSRRLVPVGPMTADEGVVQLNGSFGKRLVTGSSWPGLEIPTVKLPAENRPFGPSGTEN